VLLTERRAIENYFTKPAVRAALGEQYDALGPYDAHGAPPCNWSKRLVWKIAHATELKELEGTDLLAFLEEL